MADPQLGMAEVERDTQNFTRVVEALNALPEGKGPQLVLIAGDLVNTGGESDQIKRFNEVRGRLATPVFVVPGNHDVTPDGRTLDQSLLERFRRDVAPDRFTLEKQGALFIGVNSQLWVAGGPAAEEQLSWLKGQLRHTGKRPVFVMQHHPLYLASADEADEYFNTPLVWRARLLKLLDEAKVTAVLTGHLHRQLSGRYHNVAMVTTPSTCRNFDGSPFGYRIFNLSEDGFTEHYVEVAGTLPDPGKQQSTGR